MALPTWVADAQATALAEAMTTAVIQFLTRYHFVAGQPGKP